MVTEGDSAGAWFIVTRWQQYGAEYRSNLIRIVAVLVFYCVELANFYGVEFGFLRWPKLDELTPEFHKTMTTLAVGWISFGAAIFICLQRQIFPRALMFVSVGVDLFFLTFLLGFADGPGSPLVACYFLVIALATTRFSLALVRMATIGAGAGYLWLLISARWLGVGETVPRHEQAITMIALVLTGVILGQVVRRLRAVCDEYRQRVGGPTAESEEEAAA